MMPYTHTEIVELLRYMTPAEAERFNAILYMRPMFTPNAGAQTLAYESPADLLYYGGAAGGGKSFLTIGLAATKHRRSLLLRREGTQLRGLIEDARKIIADKGRLNENTGAYRLHDGRLLELSGCKDEKDKHRFDGRPHDLIAIDEAPQFLESQVSHITGWARTEDPSQRVRIVLTGNPPSEPEGEWILRWFAPWLDPNHPNPAKPGELRWFARINDVDKEVDGPDPIRVKVKRNGVEVEELVKPMSRTFIPAHVQDNPAYMASDYITRLQQLPEPLRSQLLYGDHTAGLEDNAWQVIPSGWVEAAFERWRALGGESYTPPGLLSALGVDVARGGRDKTVLVKRYGNWFSMPDSYQGIETNDGPKVAALILRAMEDVKMPNGDAVPLPLRPYIHIDAIGVGSSAYDSVKDDLENVYPVIFSESPYRSTDKPGNLRFRNLRADAVWNMRELLDPQYGHDIALPPSPELKSDLCAPRWRNTPQGVTIESKDDIKERIGRSPDMGDAIILAALEPKDTTLWIHKRSKGR
jgi:hypothetical protein